MVKLEKGLGDKFIVAAIQLCSNEDKNRNLKLVSQFIDNAVKDGANIIVLPEMFNCCGHTEVMVENAEEIPGSTINILSDKARTHGIYIVCGSIFEKVEKNKVHNTSVIVGRNGEILAKYSKVHLFDVDIQDKIRYKESEHVIAGQKIVIVNMGSFEAGLSICYDLRFCELFRTLALRGAKIIFVPSAFTSTTGEYHWDPLIKARAIENQVFVVAANQIGTSPNNITCYGKSMIVDPWGRVLAKAKDNENVITAEIDLNLLDEVRAEIPLFEHRRTDLY
ncbi:MAG: N-carbamoyl-D-amino acid hydrolase [Candidatus Scalindua rubra]|uniref:N-carbamoyl-D-amino acid hydrolase n=1 Tax=Candidatus Scalindua rubra TaxID=1872076 RepID=A0A1E3X627_9BACT|nr:MAG: N-carbamoyl-D-amino acid hydrolase [Candidatus Scalindua rubra]